jgi:hypothetical protein
MIRLVVLLLLAVLLVVILRQWLRAAAERRQKVWRPERIRFVIDRDDEVLKLGQFLHLRQLLERGEDGWTEARLPLPERWSVLTDVMEQGVVVLTTAHGEAFGVGGHNFAPLSTALGAGTRPAEEFLEEAWREHAALDRPAARLKGPAGH